jgi:hypothetical protein
MLADIPFSGEIATIPVPPILIRRRNPAGRRGFLHETGFQQ